MDLDLDPRWVMCKAVVLEVAWVPAELVSTSEVANGSTLRTATDMLGIF